MGQLGPVRFSGFGRGGARPAIDVGTASPASTSASAVLSQPRSLRHTFTAKIAKLARRYLKKSSAVPVIPTATEGVSLAPSSHAEYGNASIQATALDDAQSISPHLLSAHLTDGTYFSASSGIQTPAGSRQELRGASSLQEGGIAHLEVLPQDQSRLEICECPAELPPSDGLQVLARTHVHRLEHGEETGTGVQFLLVGAIASTKGTIVYAAEARPIGLGLSAFPSQVVIKMKSKAKMMRDIAVDKRSDSTPYARALAELRSMRKLAITNAALNNQALATFQDKDWLYMVSVSRPESTKSIPVHRVNTVHEAMVSLLADRVHTLFEAEKRPEDQPGPL